MITLLTTLACAGTTPAPPVPPAIDPTAPRFTVAVAGTGPDVLLIPGLASSAAEWEPTIARISPHFRTHAVQVSGFAGTPAGPNAAGPVLGPLLDQLDAYITANHLDKPAIIGHSLGGLLALELAHDHPDHVGKVLVVDSLPFYGLILGGPSATSASVEPAAARLRDAVLDETQDAFAAGEPAMMASLVKSTGPRAQAATRAASESDHRVVAQALYEDATTDLRRSLPTIHAPITVVYPWDASSPYTAAQTSAFYQSSYGGLADVRFVRVDGARHFLMIDQPEAFASAVDAFLAP